MLIEIIKIVSSAKDIFLTGFHFGKVIKLEKILVKMIWSDSEWKCNSHHTTANNTESRKMTTQNILKLCGPAWMIQYCVSHFDEFFSERRKMSIHRWDICCWQLHSVSVEVLPHHASWTHPLYATIPTNYVCVQTSVNTVCIFSPLALCHLS